MFAFSTATPEEVGIPSHTIHAFLKRLEKRQIPMHSILLMRHDKLCMEGYYAPYTKTTLHRMFSISKSFTSIAISLLEKEGLITLNDYIMDYFLDMVPDNVHPWIAHMTIRDMLTMRTCHKATTYKLNMNKNWVESFFTTTPTHPSGRIFHYDTSAAHTLAALVERLTGMELLDYLKENCLNTMDFSRDSYMLKDPFGSSMGGSGLMATPFDILKFGYLLSKQGKIKNQQVLAADYIKTAITNQCSTNVTGTCLSERQGYGYQIWQNEQKGWVCYGMGGQFIIYLPKQDILCVTTADTQGIQGGNQEIYDALYEEILPFVSDSALSKDINSYKALCQETQNLKILPLSEGGKPSTLFKNARTYEFSENPLHITSFSLHIDESHTNGTLRFQKNAIDYILPFGFGYNAISQFPETNYRCASSAAWSTDSCLYIKANLIDEVIGTIHFQFSFGETDVVLFTRKQEEHLFNDYDNAHLYGALI
jgi:Beta-lactamase class C and other penicillin binding proteins